MRDSANNPLVARLYDPVMTLPERTVLRPHREYLVSGLEGTVLDLGAGTGALFPYFDRLDTDDLRVIAVEPDPHMRTRAQKRATEVDVDVDIVDAVGENLPFETGYFDAVCVSFVFCTIPDQEQALAEVSRVLRGGGTFRFLEHVRSDGLAGRGQDLLAPCWHAIEGGCHLNRQTDALFLGDERFQTLEFERSDGLLSQALPVVRGRLKRRNRPVLSRIASTVGSFR